MADLGFVLAGLLLLVVGSTALVEAATDIAADDSRNCSGTAGEFQYGIDRGRASTAPA